MQQYCQLQHQPHNAAVRHCFDSIILLFPGTPVIKQEEDDADGES